MILLRKLFSLLLATVLAVAEVAEVVAADPARAPDAVVRIPSHGASATVIYSVEGKTLLLGCAHAYEGAGKTKPMQFDIPVPVAGAPIKATIRLVAVDYQADLSLVEIGGLKALPYVAPVAPPGFHPGRAVLSVGYDEMKQPPQKRPATILKDDGSMWWTRERPWHGRSGGGLIDSGTGTLIGVCHGYTGPPNHVETTPGGQGLYVSHQAIVRFLAQHPVGGPTTGPQAPPPQWPTAPFAAPQRTAPQQQCPS